MCLLIFHSLFDLYSLPSNITQHITCGVVVAYVGGSKKAKIVKKEQLGEQTKYVIANLYMWFLSSRSSLPSLTLSKALSSSPSTAPCAERWVWFPFSADHVAGQFCTLCNTFEFSATHAPIPRWDSFTLFSRSASGRDRARADEKD